MRYKVLGLVFFLIVGVGVAVSGLMSIKTGKTGGWGEDEFVRRVYYSINLR